MKSILIATASLTLIGAVAAQPASFSPFGTPCTIDRQTPTIGSNGLPRLGTSFEVTYQGPNWVHLGSTQTRMQPMFVAGFQRIGYPVPQGILPEQPPGCAMLAAPDLTVLMPPDPRNGSVYESKFEFKVPNEPTLAGFTFYVQWYALRDQCGIAGCGHLSAVATSDAAAVTVGT